MKFFFDNVLAKIFFLISVTFYSFNFIYSQNKVVGYYPDWMQFTLTPQNIEYENLTHIAHAFAWPQSNGNISYYQGMFNYGLTNETHKAGKKILLAIGGWENSDGFAPMSADSTSRTNFINQVVGLILTNNYDGIDFDWEFPKNIDEGKNLTKLLKELRERFNQENPDLLITMAVSAGSYNGQYIEYSKIIDFIDWFSMMGYDIHGSWTIHAGHNAPLYQPSNCIDGASDQGIHYLNIIRQVPKHQILFGLPFYGKEFDATGLYQPITGNVNDLLYTDVAPRIANDNWVNYWDDFSKVPYLLNNANTKFVTYDDTMSVKIKCDYAKENQLAGIMFWALGQDLVSNTQPLLETIGRSMGLTTSVKLSGSYYTDSFYLLDNYPNPFNPYTKIVFLIPETSLVNLKVYDILGNEVSSLVNEVKSAGRYEVNFDASDLASGVYTYILSSGIYLLAKKMILLK